MGQIVGGAAKPKRCNLNKLSQLGTPAAGEHILVSSDNSMNAAGQGNFDCYIVGDGKKAATALPLIKTYANDVDNEPTAGSDNLVKSGGVYEKTFGYSKVNYSEVHTSTYLNTRGVEVSGGTGKVVVYDILPDNEYYLDAVLYKATSSIYLVGVAIYATDENSDIPILVLKRVGANGEHYSIKINTAGISDVAKLKVAVTGNSEPVLNIKCTNSYYKGNLDVTIPPSSIDYKKAIRTNGNIETQDASNIYTFPASPGKVYIVYASPVAFPSVYVFIALYDENGNVVKTVSKFNSTNYPKSRWCINTSDLAVSTIKIVSNSSPLVVEYENTDYTQLADIDGNIGFDRINGTLPLNKMENIPLEKIEQTAILSTNGYYNVITEDSEDANSAIKYSDGSIVTDSQYMKDGVVRHYTLPDNVVVKIHFITPAFSSAYIAGCVLKNGTVVKKYLRLNSTNKTVDFVIDNRTLKADTLLLSINKNSKDLTIVTHTAEIVEAEPGDLPSAGTLVELPTLIYTLEQTAMKFGVIQRLYIEGIANSSNKTLKIDDAQNVVIDYGKQYTLHNQTYTQYVNVTADGYSDYVANIAVQENEPTKLSNQHPKILCIGDSLTDNGYPALVEFIAKCLNLDYGNIGVTMVGTRMENLDISLGDYSFQGCRGANEGRSGWAICTYLRHINIVTADKLQWDLLGLGTMTRNGVPSRSYVSFDSTNQEHLALLSSTCHGWYDVENTEEVFNYLTNSANYHINTFEYEGETYTLGSSYSSDQYSVMVKAFKYIITGGAWVPNPFYSYTTVQTSNGEYAFNLAEYINKYKTLDVDGTTRLIPGSTAGSEITSADINSADVCVPSHVVIIMSENYQRYGSNISASDIVDDLESIADLIHQYNSSVKIAFGCTRKYGAFNPSMYDFYPGIFTFNSYLFNIWKETKTRFNNSDYYIIPLYATQSILGSGGGLSFDSIDQKQRCKMIGDYTHTGDTVTSYLDRAIGVISWVASTY